MATPMLPASNPDLGGECGAGNQHCQQVSPLGVRAEWIGAGGGLRHGGRERVDIAEIDQAVAGGGEHGECQQQREAKGDPGVQRRAPRRMRGSSSGVSKSTSSMAPATMTTRMKTTP